MNDGSTLENDFNTQLYELNQETGIIIMKAALGGSLVGPLIGFLVPIALRVPPEHSFGMGLIVAFVSAVLAAGIIGKIACRNFDERNYKAGRPGSVLPEPNVT